MDSTGGDCRLFSVIMLYEVLFMKKHLIPLLSAALVFGGCGSAKTGGDVSRYETYYKAIEENTKFAQASEFYSISAEMTEWDDGTHRYYVIFDEPKISMYDIVIMAVEDNRPYEEAIKMMPSSGIFDATSSMIPNQVNSKAGFVKGLIISGECEEDTVELDMMVEWKDRTGKNVTREFISFSLGMDGIIPESSEAPQGEENDG